MMKKFLAVLLALMLCVGFAACSEQKKEDAGGEEIKAGMLARNKLTAEELDEIFPEKIIYFDNLTDMEMALSGGTIDNFGIPESTAKYVVSKNDTFKITKETLSESYAMLLKDTDQELCDRISGAITKLDENGTLAELKTKYIDGVIAGNEPEAIEMPTFDGAQTIKVAVTGDLPPMDYVTADGKATGFNVALLKAIAEELKINFELVQVNAGARAITLSSGKADVIFWSSSTKSEIEKLTKALAELDMPENAIKTVSYFTDSIVVVERK